MENSVVMLCVHLITTHASALILWQPQNKGKLHGLLQWHQKNDMHTNVTKMSTYGLDVGNAGKKPHQRKRGKSLRGQRAL